jgi:AbiV family abortive infection protein
LECSVAAITQGRRDDIDVGLISNPFAGPLSAERAEAGILALKANAERLARDSRLLYDAQRYPSAATMAAAALNEIARLRVLMELIAARKDKQRRELWRCFRKSSHDYPWEAFYPDKPAADHATLSNALAFLTSMGDKVDCLGPGNWLEPERLIQPALAKEIIATAEMLCLEPVSAGAVRLWIETVRAEPADASPAHTLDRLLSALENGGFKNQAAVLEKLSKNQRVSR